jgi:hypothetical protein
MKRRDFVKCLGVGGGAIALPSGPAPALGSAISQHAAASTARADTAGSPTPHPSAARCVLAEHQGSPTFMVAGKPYFPQAYLSYFPTQERYKAIRSADVQFFSLSITLGDRWYGAYKNGKVALDVKGIWDAPKLIDFAVLDRRINDILEVAPDALIFPRIYCDSPSWWDSYHPKEVSRTFKDGLPARQSFSSLLWRNETSEVLTKIVAHIRSSAYASRLIGFHITAGETEEAVHHNWCGSCDYSIVAQSRFKEWLMRKYGADSPGTWKLFQKKLGELTIPTPAERGQPGQGDFLDPESSRLVIDYRTFRCDEIVESIEALCKAVKDASQGDLLTGTFYGHTLAQWLDHMALARMLQSKYIDFVASTTLGAPTASIIGAGKIFYNEGDERTAISKWISETRPEVDPYHVYDAPGWLRNEDMRRSLEHLKDEFVHTICRSAIIWWFDLWGGWYDDKRVHGLFSQMQKVGNRCLELPRQSVAQICVIVDEKAFLYGSRLAREGKTAIAWLSTQAREIARIGAPHDLYLLNDIETIDFPRYRLCVFLNAFVLDDAQRTAIKTRCLNDRRTVVWLHAPGLINTNLSVTNVAELVNMRVGREDAFAEGDVHLRFPDFEEKYRAAAVAPFISVNGGADTIYGWSTRGDAVLAQKNEPNHVTVLACNPPLPWRALQFFAVNSGVHIYSNAGDIVYGNQSILAVKAAIAGARAVRLRQPCSIMEVLDSHHGFSDGPVRETGPRGEMTVEFEKSGDVRVFQILR